jgi:hypothetical protein
MITLRRAALFAAVTLIVAGPAAAPAFAEPTPSPSAPGSSTGGTAQPQGSVSWAVQPATAKGPDHRSSFTYTNLAPGTTVHDYVSVSNFSQNAVSYDLYATDGFTNISGALDMQVKTDQAKDIGSWVKLGKNKVSIEASNGVNEPFELTIPFDATPGDHTGGIVASVTSQSGSGDQAVAVDRRVASPIYLRVSGPLTGGIAIESVSATYHATFNPFGGGDAEISYTVHNTGNIRLDVKPAASVTGVFGTKLASADGVVLPNLLPGASVRMTQKLKVFPLGPLSVHVTAHPSEIVGIPPAAGVTLKDVSGDASAFALPLLMLLILVVIIGIVVAVIFLMRRNRSKVDQKVAKAVARAKKETAEELAAASSTDGNN